MATIHTRQTHAAQRSGRRMSSQAHRQPATRQVKRLFVVRESTAYKWQLFGAMMLQVLERHQAMSSVAAVLSHGVALVQPGPAGEALREQYNAVPIRGKRQGRGRASRVVAYLFIIDEDAFLLSQMSASRADDDGTNAFGALLAQLIFELRPEELHTGPAGRFGRATEVFARVGNAVKAAGCRVFSDEAPEGLNLNESSDALRWDMYGLIAAAEVREILKRLTIARLLEARAGHWPLGRRQIVLGYACSADKTPSVTSDPTVVSWVRALITMGADETLTLDDIVRRLAAMGLTTPKLQDLYGHAVDDADDEGDLRADPEVVTLGAAVRPRDIVSRLYGHLETYLTGNYRFELTCPAPGVTEWCSTPVIREDGDQFGVFHLVIPVGLPVDGWAPPETIRKAIALRCEAKDEARRSGGAAHESDHKPFAGFRPWTVGEGEQVLSAKFASYHVMTRPKVHAGMGWHEGAGKGVVLAALNPGDFHKDFAARVLSVLDDTGFDAAAVVFASRAMSAEILARPDVAQWAATIEKLQTTNEGLAMSIGYARGSADTMGAELFVASLHLNNTRITELKKQIAAAAHAPVAAPPSRSDVTGLPELLRLLSMGRAQYDPIVADRLHRLVRRLRFDVTPFHVSWTCELRLPTDVGIMHVPVSGRVPNVVRARGVQKAAVERARTDYLAQLWIDDGLSIGEIAEALGWGDPESVERRLRREVVDVWPVTPAMRHAVIACPLPDVRRVLARHARGQQVEAGWDALVVETYTGVATWVQAWWADAVGDRQRVIDVLTAAGTQAPELLDRGLPLSALAQESGVSDRKIAEIMAAPPNGRGGRLTAPLFGRVLDKDKWTRATPDVDRTVRLRRCPSCGTRSVTLVCRVPEAGSSPMLCATCMRRPDDPQGVVFPDSYRSVIASLGRLPV